MYDTKREFVKISLAKTLKQNSKYLKKTDFKPYLKIICIRLIVFYQKYLSKKTCLFKPSCSQYTLECIDRHGAIIGILLGAYRILRCNPFSKGGYDPPPDNYFKKRWLL